MPVLVDGVEGIDSVAADAATAAAEATEATEAAQHVHSRERWVGVGAAAEGLAPYQIPVGANDGDFGAWTELFAAEDTPMISGKTKFDPHRILLVDVPITKKLLFLQFAWGAVAATAYGDGDYTEVYALPEKPADGKAHPMCLRFPRIDAGTPLWIRAKQDNGKSTDGTVNLFIGIHEYDE